MILPGTDFDDEFMDNDYTQENGSDDEDDEVVCTSNIGLESVTRDGINRKIQGHRSRADGAIDV